MVKIKKVAHVALVVDDLEAALSFWRDALGLPLQEVRDEPRENTRLAFLPAGESEIELLQPTSDDSGMRRFLAKRGPGMHHVCLAVDDLDGLLAGLAARGVRLIDPSPRTSSAGKRYAFVHPASTGGVLLELYEE